MLLTGSLLTAGPLRAMLLTGSLLTAGPLRAMLLTGSLLTGSLTGRAPRVPRPLLSQRALSSQEALTTASSHFRASL